jgi:assimilatory nitrate reductase catalytic subunit
VRRPKLTLGLLDPYSRQPAYKQCAVRVEKLTDQEAAALSNLQARSY